MPKTEEITYGRKTEEGKIESVGTVTLNVPTDMDEARQMYGDEVCLSNILASVIIAAQGIARKAETPEKAQEILDAWRPGVSRQRGAGGMSKTALVKKLRGLSPEKLKALIEEAGLADEEVTA